MLGRRALCSLLRPSVSSVRVGGSGAVAGRRGFADNTPATATDAAHQDFITAWKKLAPNMEPPKTPLTFMKPRPTVPGSIPTKLTINFVLPYQVELSSKEGSKRSYQGGFMQDMPGEFQHLNKWYSEWIDECERVNNSG